MIEIKKFSFDSNALREQTAHIRKAVELKMCLEKAIGTRVMRYLKVRPQCSRLPLESKTEPRKSWRAFL